MQTITGGVAPQCEEAEKVVRMFQLKCWPDNGSIQRSIIALTDLLVQVEEWQTGGFNGRRSTCVMSRYGTYRYGTPVLCPGMVHTGMVHLCYVQVWYIQVWYTCVMSRYGT